MRKKLTAMFLSFCMVSVFVPQSILADDVLESGNLLTDGEEIGDGAVTELAEELVKRTEEEVQKVQEEKAAAEEAARKAEEKRRAEEARKKAEEAARKAEEERVAKRQEIVDYALQFEGNPYVYGGTSLTNGADCSGFVMSVFANFGYELPRVAASQYIASQKKDISEIETGDLVFYGNSPEGIYHVALYIGDGKIIHASTAATGIKISDYDYEQPYGIGTYVE
ncbi:MAG: C40 family peptidase [Clostridiales bacterium]|nr:C40 family peptidase [Clostridiales bacterium]